MSHIDYEIDIPKHYVRRYGWLDASKQQKLAVRKRSKRIPLRYFTFCAAAAIDVFMLEREGILQRSDKTGRLEGVYFCEKNEESFGTIADLIGSPTQGFQGEFEKIVLFEDDEETEGKNFDDDDFFSSKIRKRLRYKDTHSRLKEAFPFDIINLDVFGVMFPARKGVITPLIKSLARMLEWQTSSKFPVNDAPCKKFTLFLTSHIDPDITDTDAIQQLENRLGENLRTNTDFLSAFLTRYGHDQVEKLVKDNFAEFFCLSLSKYIINRALFHLGWKVSYRPQYLYNRDDKYVENKKYQVMHSVSVYERIPDFGNRLDDPIVGEYAKTVTDIVNEGVKWVDDLIEDDKEQKTLIQDLRDIIQFRDQYR